MKQSRFVPWGLLHLFSLSALTFAQPLLDRLQRNPGFLTHHRLKPLDLVVTVAVLMLLPGILLSTAVVISAWWRGPTAQRRVQHGAIALLLGIWLINIGTAASNALKLRTFGIPGAMIVVVAIAVAVWLFRNYRREGWVYSALSLSGLGLLVFPTVFFTSQRIRAVCFPEVTLPQLHAGRPIPIVMLIFDGMCGMSLLKEDRTIDSVRYPGFARLAEMSTWYRNATTVHYRTDNAVPAILTGCIPPGNRIPFVSEYPDNLFTFLIRTEQYEMTVFEPYTRLCPDTLNAAPRTRSSGERIGETLRTLVIVYLETSFPHDVLINRPQVPRPWLNMAGSDMNDSIRTGMINYAWDDMRTEQYAHFEKCLRPTAGPWFRFLHVALPHYPWIYLPSGNRYRDSSSFEEFPLGTHGLAGEDWGPDPLPAVSGWQRYLWQVQCADRLLGRMLDHLEEQDLLDEALLVVTADHGTAFKPGRSLRTPEKETLPALLPVPLFIKLPGQSASSIEDRNVETIDILPTIADVVDLDLPVATDGASLLDSSETPRPRKTLVLQRDRQLALDPDFPEKYTYVDEMIRQFGTGGTDDRLLRSQLHPEWQGRSLTDFPSGPPSEIVLTPVWGGDFVSPAQPEIIPCYQYGWARIPSGMKRPVQLVLSVNGRIADVSRTLTDPKLTEAWLATADEALYHTGENDVRFFEVRERRQGLPELRRCPLTTDDDPSPTSSRP